MLDYAWRTNKYGLPYAGGWMEQPLPLLHQMTAAENTYNAFRVFSHPSTKWGEMPEKHPHYWKIILQVLELRKRYGNE